MQTLPRAERDGQEPLAGQVGPPGLEMQRVVPVVSLGVVHDHSADADDPTAPPGIDFGGLLAAVQAPTGLFVGSALAAAFVVAAVAGDGRLAGAGPLFVGLVLAVRFVDRHVAFSFGAGFVGYRGDLGWPHGVQEDDDVHWNWRRS
jgi:hypothetical protein